MKFWDTSAIVALLVIEPSTGSAKSIPVHALRAADAFQLAAALHWCQRQPMNRHVVSFDTRLGDAAYKEGFTILPTHID